MQKINCKWREICIDRKTVLNTCIYNAFTENRTKSAAGMLLRPMYFIMVPTGNVYYVVHVNTESEVMVLKIFSSLHALADVTTLDWVYQDDWAFHCTYPGGSPENAGLENGGPKKSRGGKCRTVKWRTKVHGWKMMDLKMTYFKDIQCVGELQSSTTDSN